VTFEFHENMVIWRRKKEAWNGFGFLGESKHGKTPLSFAFAHVLFQNGVREIIVFDDCFKLESGRIRQCRTWGNRDALAETYYYALSQAMTAVGHSISQLEPGEHTYTLNKVALYLLLMADGPDTVKKERCSRMDFVERLMPSNPFTWDYPKPGKNVVLQRFKDNWSYFIVRRRRKASKELIDRIVNEALEDSKMLED